MNITIDVYLYAHGNSFSKGGSFVVLPSDFKKDPDWTAAIVAYEWIQQIKREFGYSDDFEINKVIYNGDNEITENVKSVIPVDHDDLPF